MPDVEVLRKLRDAGVPALLYGPPGTGKTSLIEAAFGDDLITVAGDGDTTAADLVGEYTQNPDGTFAFIYGPLIRAMQEGKVLFIDDATLISPAVLAVAYPAMDGRREITVKAHKGEVIKAADGFYVSQPATTPESTARSSPRPCPAGSLSRSRSPPTTTSPAPSRSTPAPSRPPGTSPPGRPAARSAGHPSCANCSPSPRSPPSSARTPPSPTWSASPPRKTPTP